MPARRATRLCQGPVAPHLTLPGPPKWVHQMGTRRFKTLNQYCFIKNFAIPFLILPVPDGNRRPEQAPLS